MDSKKIFRNWLIGLIAETIITVIFIISLGNYSSNLNNEYLHGHSMNLMSALKILGDSGYIGHFIWSIIFILLLVIVGFCAFRKSLTINDQYSRLKLLLLVGYPMVNLILLIALLIVFYSPVLLAAIIGLIVVGVVFLAVNSEQ